MTHRPHPLLPRPLFFALIVVFWSPFWVGCKTDMDGSYTELLRVLQPDASCLINTNNPSTSTGIYDPTYNDSAGYTLSFLVKNNLAKAADDVVASGELDNVHGVVNDVKIIGFEGCWYIDDGAPLGAAASPNGVVDCAALPDRSGFFFAPQTALEGGDQQVASVTVLNLDDMRGLFGLDFTPSLLPIEGQIPYLNPGTNDTDLQYYVSQSTQSPADVATRSVYWGKSYPTRRDVVVNVQLRGRAQTQSGTTFHTNWLTYPITVAPGALRNQCGFLQPKVCNRGACANGDACSATGTCSDNSTCKSIVLLSGEVASLGTCLPAQGFASATITCTPVGCDAVN